MVMSKDNKDILAIQTLGAFKQICRLFKCTLHETSLASVGANSFAPTD
jgi:hypothetical protein